MKILVLRGVFGEFFMVRLVRFVVLSFCGGVGSSVIPGDGFCVRVADAVGDDGRLFWSPVVGPAVADLSASPILHVLMAFHRL